MSKLIMLPILLVSLVFSFPLMASEDINAKHVLMCDQLAAHPLDPTKHGFGVEFKDINATKAISACIKDLKNDPQNMRLLMNLGRAYNKLERYKDSYRYAELSANGGYPFAVHLLSLHYLYGEGVAKDKEKEINYLKKAADLGVEASVQNLVNIELDEELMKVNFSSAYQTIENANKLGLAMNKALGDFYYRLNEKIKNDILNAQSIESLNLVNLQVYRDNLLASQEHYTRHLKLNKNEQIQKRLKEINNTLEFKSTEENIQKKLVLKKAITGVNTPNKLEFNYEIGSKLALSLKANKWAMVTDKGQISGLNFKLVGKQARMKNQFNKSAWKTAQETWRYIQRYDNNWKIVVSGQNKSDIHSFILRLRQAMLDTKTLARVNVLGIVE